MPRTPNGRPLAQVREDRALTAYGCTYAELMALNGGARHRAAGSMANAYAEQRKNAAKRGIDWAITFPEWTQLWIESGHWADRGASRGKYCMARHGDAGAYKVGNVSIQLFEANAVDAGRKAGPLHVGSGRGWVFRPDCPKRPYHAVVATKYVGAYATPEEATAARDRYLSNQHA